MKTSFKALRARGGIILAFTVAAFAASGGAQAGGTTAGTDIDNTATLGFAVGGVTQTPINASATFKVDNKINHTVATTNGAPALIVAPGQTSVVRNFTVTNNGNLAQGYVLSVANVTSGQAALGANDSADLDSTTCVVRVNGTAATAIGSLIPDASIPVTVSCTIPASAADNEHIAIALVARATDAGTATAVVETTGAATAGIDVVFADNAGTGVAVDGLRDGRASGLSAYHVSTAVLQITKAVATQCDPLNGATDPKNIPGAYVRYTITVANTGTASASLTTITDTLVNAVQFDKDLIKGNSVANCNSGTPSESTNTANTGNGFSLTYPQRGFNPKYMTTGANADGATHSDPTIPGGTITINFTEAMPAAGSYGDGELKKNESLSITYQVKIN